MFSFLSPDSKFMQAVSRITDLVLLNVLFLLTCLPVFTVGAAVSSLYCVCFQLLRNREGGIFKSYLRAFREGDLFYAIVMLFGNLATFLPLGFFPGLLFRNLDAKKIFAIGFGFSFGAECCQFFLGRHCDVDDVILNVLGVFLGYWLCLWFRHLWPGFCRKLLCQR